MLPPVLATRALAAVALALALGCGEGAQEPAAKTAPPASAASTASAAAEAAPAPRPARNERPLPAFEAVTLAGEPFSVRELVGRRAVIFLFQPDAREAAPTADAVARVAKASREQNFAVVGIAQGSGPERIRAFAAEHALDFPLVDDSAGAFAGRLGLRAPAAVVGADAEGYVTFAVGGPPPDAPDAVAVVETQLREALRLPSEHAAVAPTLGVRPPAPAFQAERLEGGERFESSSLRGRPAVLVFFLYTCPHCHHALEFLKGELAKLPEEKRPRLVGISVGGTPTTVRERLAADGLDFFPVLLDLDHQIRAAYGVLAGVPDIFVLDGSGAVVERIQGWRDDRDPALMRMWLAKVSGQPVPMLLHSTGFSGSDVCGVCHDKEYETWVLTPHAHAFDTLVKHAADADPECVSCHVVGFGKPGGYAISPRTPDFENVGCETCHGRGGPHLSPAHVTDGNYEAVCVDCHDAKHSLGFEYASFLPKVSHAANAELASLPLEKRQALLAAHERPRSALLPTGASYVGSEACRSCHAKEFETWAASPHGSAMASLESKGKAGDETCQQCHVTALGLPGGFPKGAAPASHADLARVGCESCHGPGGNHVGPDAKRVGTIVSLGDKCDSCVILQICGSCHDDANDPGFEFVVEQKIEAQKHGTIEAAASRAPTAGLAPPAPPATAGAVGALERGFALLDSRS
jgi:peroxiredoxin